jgi:Putative beta-barrel porin-2, OmpL-like. bbp2
MSVSRAWLVVTALVIARPAWGQTTSPTAPSAADETKSPPPTALVVEHATLGKVTLGGYVEAAFSYNFNQPSNGITNERGFDNRHDTFTLSNAALDTQWEKGPAAARLIAQFGQTPDTYYLAEPSLRGTASVPTEGASTWKYLQQAYVSYKAPLGLGLTFQLGIFTSPIGLESMAIKDDWNWSRSNLFFGLPFYHTGLRATQQVTDKLAATIAVYNGWNSVLDDNPEKSFSGQLAYTDSDRLLFSVLYFGGVERPEHAPEGRAFRQLFDAWVQGKIVSPLWVAMNVDTGFEPNNFGTSWWGAAAGYVRVQPHRVLYLAARGDFFREHRAGDAAGTASPIIWPVAWVASGTGTFEVRPVDGLLARLEYRHDQAADALYFAGHVAGAGTTKQPFVPNARRQDTLTLGATAWF